jgi:ABC-2 type transport system ATP-binding protein
MRGLTLQTNPSAISVRNVEKSFRGRPVLRKINLEVRRGELLGLLGPNGAGKTTLLKMMATLTLPDAGTIEVDGIDIKKDPLLVRSRIGLCGSDDRSFYFRLTARENLTFFGALAGLRGRRLQRRIEETLKEVSLRAVIDRRFGEFSSGMRQRMMVARALLADPEIVFFDEPTRAIDPLHADELRKMIRNDLVDARGKTVVLATNVLEEAWAICDRVAVVSNGTIAAVAPPNELRSRQVSAIQPTPMELFKAITSYGG